MGFQMSQSDTSLFAKYDGIYVIALLLYGDNIILTGSNKSKVQAVIQELCDVFDLRYRETFLISNIIDRIQREW